MGTNFSVPGAGTPAPCLELSTRSWEIDLPVLDSWGVGVSSVRGVTWFHLWVHNIPIQLTVINYKFFGKNKTRSFL